MSSVFKSIISGVLEVRNLFTSNHHAEFCCLSAQIHMILTDGCFQS